MPHTPTDASDQDPAPAASAGELPRRPKLLVVDDQAFNIELIRQAFSKDHQIFAAKSGAAALSMCARELPDLVLLDVVMPDMDGFEVCARMQADPVLREIPVIFITAHGDEATEARGLEVGAVDFISKPINPKTTRARVGTHLALQSKTNLLKTEIQNRKAAQEALLESEARLELLSVELAKSNVQLRALVARMNGISEDESSRLYRQLYDDLGQTMSGLILHLSALGARLAQLDPVLAAQARAMLTQIHDMVHTTRDMARRLGPTVLVGDLGVLTVIDSLAKEVCLRTGASYELASDIATGIDSEMLTDPKLATVVFRVVQEAMSNIERHAEASRVDITVEARFGCLTVEVRDNGRGIANYQLSGEGTLGILGMRERAAAIGGEVSVEGFPGKGTAVTLRVADLRAQESGAGTQISRAHG